MNLKDSVDLGYLAVTLALIGGMIAIGFGSSSIYIGGGAGLLTLAVLMCIEITKTVSET